MFSSVIPMARYNLFFENQYIRIMRTPGRSWIAVLTLGTLPDGVGSPRSTADRSWPGLAGAAAGAGAPWPAPPCPPSRVPLCYTFLME